MTTLEEITALLPLITPYSMPADSTAASTLYDIAQNRVSQDAAGINPAAEKEAICWYIAHLLYIKSDNLGVTSEHLGNFSKTYAADRTSPYLSEYNRVISTSGDVFSTCGMVEHDDAELADRYGLDNFIGEW